jgi:hypothetical protein
VGGGGGGELCWRRRRWWRSREHACGGLEPTMSAAPGVEVRVRGLCGGFIIDDGRGV